MQSLPAYLQLDLDYLNWIEKSVEGSTWRKLGDPIFINYK